MLDILKKLLGLDSKATTNQSESDSVQDDETYSSPWAVKPRVDPEFIQSKINRRAYIQKEGAKFGLTTLNCPSCGVSLPKFPGRKIACKSCKKPIYPRVSLLSLSDEKRLFKESELKTLREFDAFSSSLEAWERIFREEYELFEEKVEIAKNWGCKAEAVPDSDARWGQLNKEYLSSMDNNDFYAARNTRVEMIRQLIGEGKLTRAKVFVGETIYLAYTYQASMARHNLSIVDDKLHASKEYIDSVISDQTIPSPEMYLYSRKLNLTVAEVSQLVFEYQEQTGMPHALGLPIQVAILNFKRDFDAFNDSLKQRDLAKNK
jgi:hypothetical protein